jgi:hypothetical protein
MTGSRRTEVNQGGIQAALRALLAMSLLLGCSSSEPTVAGLWRFGYYTDTRDDFSTYQLEVTGTDVTGRGCQTSHSCNDSQCVVIDARCDGVAVAGAFVDGQLKLRWEFSEGGGVQQTAIEAAISPDGERLIGSGTSSKCACAFALRAARQYLGQKAPVP